MSVSNSALLTFVAARYDEVDRPVTAADAAGRFDVGRESLRRQLDTLAGCELVARQEGGYRPTVTGREFLDLDVAGDLAVVDPE